jgi:adenosylhomocysteine nucleosidase
MIAVFAAMSQELAGLERQLVGCQRSDVGGYRVRVGYWHERRVLLCQTGIGRRAEEAARLTLDRIQPRIVLSVGLCGAINAKFKVGDLVLCESVHLGAARNSQAEAARSDVGLSRLAQESAEKAGLRLRSGQSVTVDHVIGERSEKDALRQATGTDVVEMESYWVGLVAQEMELPFLIVRVVSDGARDAVPHIPGLVTPEGEYRASRALPYLLRHPASLPQLLRLARGATAAVANLTQFLEAFVQACEVTPVAKPA